MDDELEPIFALLAILGVLGLVVFVITSGNPKAAAQTPTPSAEVLPGPTLAAMIGGSLNSPMFHHWYVLDEKGKAVDAVNGGESSCAFYVSVLLQSVGLCDGVYPHMDRLIESMERCGWTEIKVREPDASIMVVVWGETYGNRHLGFAFEGSEMAVSHSSFENCPRRHSRTLRDGREIARRWTHPDLANLAEYLKLHGVL